MAREATFLPGKKTNDSDEFTINTEQRPYTDAEASLDEWMEASRQEGMHSYIIVKKLIDSSNSNSKLQSCDSFPTDKYDYHSLQLVIKKRWGSGDYRLLCFASLDGSKPRMIQNQLISIAEELEPKKNGDNSIIGDLMAELRAMRSELTKPKGGDDFMQNLAMYATIMDKMRPPPEPARNPMKEFIETMGMMQSLGFMPGGAPLAEEVNPMWTTLAQALPTLINGAMQNRQSTPVINPNPVSRKQRSPKHDKKPDMITYYLNQLEKYAKDNAPTETVADTIVEKTPDFDALMAIVYKVDFIAKYTASGFWAKSEHREWLIDVREWLLAHDGKQSKYSDQFSDTPEPPDSGSIEPLDSESIEPADSESIDFDKYEV